MSAKSEHDQVIREEAEAEIAYRAHLKQAAILASQLADDTARTESERAAAAESAIALRKVEEARVRAAQEQKPEAVKRTFWERLMDNL